MTILLLGGVKMAKCDICGKGVHFGNNVSHSNRKANRTWGANVQKVKINMLLLIIAYCF